MLAINSNERTDPMIFYLSRFENELFLSSKTKYYYEHLGDQELNNNFQHSFISRLLKWEIPKNQVDNIFDNLKNNINDLIEQWEKRADKTLKLGKFKRDGFTFSLSNLNKVSMIAISALNNEIQYDKWFNTL